MWIVLDPENDVTIQDGFATDLDAVNWVQQQRNDGVTPLAAIEAWVVAPYDPERST